LVCLRPIAAVPDARCLGSEGCGPRRIWSGSARSWVPIAERAELTDSNPPRLEKYDRWGRDASQVVMPPTFEASRRELVECGAEQSSAPHGPRRPQQIRRASDSPDLRGSVFGDDELGQVASQADSFDCPTDRTQLRNRDLVDRYAAADSLHRHFSEMFGNLRVLVR
jgi:hypothetical protein